jgi:hypothetical protein
MERPQNYSVRQTNCNPFARDSGAEPFVTVLDTSAKRFVCSFYKKAKLGLKKSPLTDLRTLDHSVVRFRLQQLIQQKIEYI